VPSCRCRLIPANSRSSWRVWYSSSEVVSTSETSVSGTTFRATESYSDSRQSSTFAPESLSW
jgi:hypothetical protein